MPKVTLLKFFEIIAIYKLLEPNGSELDLEKSGISDFLVR
jgi:hypothetical protein